MTQQWTRFSCQVTSVDEGTIYIRTKDNAGTMFEDPFPDAELQYSGIRRAIRKQIPADSTPSDEPIFYMTHTTSPQTDEDTEEDDDDTVEDPFAQIAFSQGADDDEEIPIAFQQQYNATATRNAKKSSHEPAIQIDPDHFKMVPELPPGVTRIIFFDGGSRPPPAGAAAAIVMYTKNEGRWSLTTSQAEFLNDSTATNNIAEHRALFAAVKYAFTNLADECTAIAGDSELAIRQLLQEYSTQRPELVKLVGREINLARKLKHLSLHHFKRILGNPADGPCNAAMDARKNLLPIGTLELQQAFKLIEGTTDEPPYLKRKKIPRLFVSREREKATTNQHNNRQPTADITPQQVHCRHQTFWQIRREDTPLFAHALNQAIGDYPFSKPEVKEEIWKQFFLFPQTRLIRDRTQQRKALRQRLLNITPAPNETPANTRTQEEKQINAAKSLIANGFLSKAARALERHHEPLPDNAPDTIRQLHPKSSMNTPLLAPTEPALISVCPKRLLQVLIKQAKGRAPGPSGWTEDLFAQAALESEEILAALASMIRDVCNAEVSRPIREIITASRLITPCNSGKIRPIAIGEAILKIAEAYLFGLTQDFVHEEFSEIQYAFREDGAAQIIHEVRGELHKNTNTKAVLLDCKNAFNTMRRGAIFESIRDPRLRILKPLVHMCYAMPSILHCTLLPDLLSEEGVRQGSILSGFLFCTTLHPTMKHLATKHPNVRFYVYMDDITVLGEDPDLDPAVADLIAALAELGLLVNLQKSCVIETEPCTSTAFSIPMAKEGARLLGAWIGDDQHAISFLKERVDASSKFFEKIDKLPAEQGLLMLTKCGIPRINHLCRTMPPHLTDVAIPTFDSFSMSSLSKFMRVPLNNIDDSSIIAAHLPTSMGGLGITQYHRINACAYEASIKMEPQLSLVKALNKKLLQTLPEQFQQHLSRCKSDNAWLLSGRPSSHFHRALQIRLSCAGVRGQWRCDCGSVLDNERDAINHALGCVQLQGPNATARSSAIKDEVARFCRQNSIPCSVEPMLISNPDGTKIRADLRITLAEEDVYVDVVVATGSAKSYQKKTTRQLEDQKTRQKEDMYLRPVQALGGTFVTFFLESMGKLGDEADRLAKRLEKSAIVPEENALRSRLSRTLHHFNGAILANAFRSLAKRN